MGATYIGFFEPNESLLSGGWIPIGAPSFHEALQITGPYAGDSTHVQPTTSGTAMKVGMGPPPPLPPGAHVKYLRLQVTGTITSIDTPTSLRVDLNTSRGSIPIEISDFIGIPYQSRSVHIAFPPGGAEWTVDDLNELTVSLTARLSGPALYITALVISVFVNNPPLVQPLGPGTVTTTSFPVLPWSYDDPEDDPQEEVEVKLFSGASYVSDPATETARLIGTIGPFFFGDTQVQSSGVSNGSYRWAIRARDVGSGAEDWGNWGQWAFTVSNPAPGTPAAIITPDPTSNRYIIGLFSGSSLYATEGFIVERSDDSGVTWDYVRGAARLPWSGLGLIIFDYEAPRMAYAGTVEVITSVRYNAPISYNAPIGYNQTVSLAATGPQNPVRYRVTAYRILAGEYIYSPSVVVAPDPLLGNGTTWLKHPSDPSKSIVIQHMADWETTSEEDMAALRASGRADWVVFGDVPSLEKGDLDITFPGDAAWEAFEELRAPANGVGESLLLQTCFGDTVLEQHWVRLGSNRSIVRVTHGGQNQRQYRRGKVGFFETLRPAVT